MDQIQALIQVGAKASLFPPTSRYHAVDSATFVSADGRTIAYLRRRFVPPPENFALILEHTVVQGDRLDNLARKTVNGRIGRPEEIAHAIYFLADEVQSSFMTGQALVVDGGATARLSTE